ncbi:hypothetical protein [Roseateles asaccharophilus]|uniref:DUF2306 domain-containing protein n=1 Tax=Roseateles asaccharophilus TaxID=582607 RepID=A0ABU2AEK9_9BURK|nr:hypothetical protein [Roseateles asaccharophilus]MDR7335649.1 hypothetical protein [Roseateles asaccharophilus]
MPLPLSTLGIAHTLISLLPVVAGVVSFARNGRIDISNRWGQAYLAGLVLSVFTAFGLSSTGGINPGHVLGVLALLAVSAAWLLPRLPLPKSITPHLQAFGLSFSFFLLLVPGINETLTRLPAASPLASGPEDPVVRTALLAWLVLFIVGFTLQSLRIRAAQRRERAR